MCVCETHSSVVSLGIPLGRVRSPLLLQRTTVSEHVQPSGQRDRGKQTFPSVPVQRKRNGRRERETGRERKREGGGGVRRERERGTEREREKGKEKERAREKGRRRQRE